MKKRFMFLSIIFFLLIAPIDVKCNNIPISNIYKQGIHSIKDIGEYEADVKLIKGEKTSLFVINSDNDITAYIKLPLNESLVLQKINKNHKIIIVGDGEVAITYEKS